MIAQLDDQDRPSVGFPIMPKRRCKHGRKKDGKCRKTPKRSAASRTRRVCIPFIDPSMRAKPRKRRRSASASTAISTARRRPARTRRVSRGHALTVHPAHLLPAVYHAGSGHAAYALPPHRPYPGPRPRGAGGRFQ